jgi:hypothetical protein
LLSLSLSFEKRRMRDVPPSEPSSDMRSIRKKERERKNERRRRGAMAVDWKSFRARKRECAKERERHSGEG